MSSSRLSILFISSNMPWRGGGTFYRAMGFARHLVQQGHNVTLLLTSLEEKKKFVEDWVDGVHLVQSPALLTGKLRSGWDMYEVGRRINWLNGRSYDLIHTFESRPVVIYPALASQKQNQACLILDWCDWLGSGGLVEERAGPTKFVLRPVETYFEQHFRLHAHGTTVINNPLREQAIKLGVAPESIHLLPNGAEIERIKVLDRDEVRRTLNLEQGAIIIGHLGHASPRDAALMSAAFAKLYHTQSNAHLMLIGDYRQTLSRQMETQKALINTGFVEGEKLNQHLAACDLLWLPLTDTVANRGRWPMKVSDYLSSGRAIISTRTGDLVNLFERDRPVGLLTEDTPESFAQTTLDLLTDHNKRQNFEKNARHLAETTYDWTLVTKRLISFYYQVMGG